MATVATDELQCEPTVTSCVVPSLNVPVALNCCVAPAETDAFAGVMVTDTSVPVLTVTVVVAFRPYAAAVIVACPAFFPRTIPEPRTFTICGFDDFHDTFVIVAVLPSLYFPVTLSCSEVPFATVGFAGLIAMDTRLTFDTVSVVDWLIEPQSASIVVLPAATLVARPAAVIVAIDGLIDFHKTCCVMSWVELSLNVPVAVNCFAAPTGMVEFVGATASETSVAAVTVTDPVPLIPPAVAVTVDIPPATAVASPVASMLSTL